MNEFKGEPSKWLLNNSKGYPDFLFTILVYSFLLFTIISCVWVGLIMVAAIGPESGHSTSIQEILKDMRIGIVAIAGLVFGLAGNYTVRRFKKDENYIQTMKQQKGPGLEPVPGYSSVKTSVVAAHIDEEDI